MKTQLTKEQSQHLIDLGVPKEKASEFGIDDYSSSSPINGGLIIYGDDYPIFTLTDLLEILPKEIDLKFSDERIAHSYFKITVYKNEWIASYEFYEPVQGAYTVKKEELIDSLYELCVWCLENGYLKFE